MEGIDGAPLFADWEATVCVQQKTSDILKIQCQFVHANVSNTEQHFLLLTFLCESLMVEEAKCEFVKASSLRGEAHLDLTWGFRAVRLSYMKCKGYSHCLKSEVH